MTSRLSVESTSVTPAVAGRSLSLRARTVARASMAPVAPMEWPWRDLVELTGICEPRCAEDLMDGGGFGGVVGLGAGAMGVDVADVIGRGVRVFDGLAHGCGGSFGPGWVMWLASADMPKPTISAKMGALRACAESRVSRTNMAAPSPRVIPSRLAAKGRQRVGETTRMESQAR